MQSLNPLKAWPAEGVYLAWLGDDIVVLSIANDAYSCLVGAARYLSPADDGGILISTPAVLDDLQAAGLITPMEPAGRALTPQSALHDLATSSATPFRRAPGLAANALWGARILRRAAFPELIAIARALKARNLTMAPVVTPRIAADVGAFTAVLPWLPFQGVCLHRAFLLVRYLALHGVSADWVFGVRTWPFAAHCWVQIGHTVLGDSVARVRAYTPILVV